MHQNDEENGTFCFLIRNCDKYCKANQLDIYELELDITISCDMNDIQGHCCDSYVAGGCHYSFFVILLYSIAVLTLISLSDILSW